MPEAIWVDEADRLAMLADALRSQPLISVDTEFLRERTFFPKLCLLQVSAGSRVWCVDTLQSGSLEALAPALTLAATRKAIHAARQDLEVLYQATGRIVSPAFDTQIAAACVGMKPQIGYAELVHALMGIALPKAQTRTDWSRRPLTRAQLEYAADDVFYLGEAAARLDVQLKDLGREHWAAEDCAALENPLLYEPGTDAAWHRLRGLARLAPKPRGRAKAIAIWRETAARERDLPRAWVLPDPAVFAVAEANPASHAALHRIRELPQNFNEGFAASLLQVLEESASLPLDDASPGQEARPTPEQRASLERLSKIVDARAQALQVSPELLAPRGELKSLALGIRDTRVTTGWRRAELGERLLESLQ